MAFVLGSKNSFTVKAYIGDCKTLLAFNFADQANATNLAGFTINCQPPGQPSYYLLNELQFQDPSIHAQIGTERPNSTANAPIQKYRWVHVPGTNPQGIYPVVGNYRYVVTPRYFDANESMQPLDASLSAAVTVPVGRFKKGALALGFTRGYMQSEAFARHFGNNTRVVPANEPLQFDTSAQAGQNSTGEAVTYADIYAWMGSTARQQVFALLDKVRADTSLQLDVFAYDLNEPDIVTIFLKLAAQGRIRIILDNAPLHVTHEDAKTGRTVVSPEDAFTTLFNKQAKPSADILRGSFGRYSHDKVFILSRNGTAVQVLTGSTNFSVTGLYVNANHVLVFDDANVASEYAKVFEESWTILSKNPKGAAAVGAFSSSSLATQPHKFQSATVPKISITFSPHSTNDAGTILSGLSDRINQEKSAQKGNVLFAVMQLTGSQTPVYETLSNIHAAESIFSYGISDAPQGVYLYKSGSKNGVLVTGKPGKTTLPTPFDQVPSPPGHEIHDKFVVCGLNGSNPVVYCGSSNLASGGEAENGDNLLQISDPDVATAFAIEALLLVDHYNFLDRYATTKKTTASKPIPAKPASKKAVASAVSAKKQLSKSAGAKQ